VTGAWDAIKSAVKNAAGKVKSWIQGVIDKLNSVRLPGWLTGHSPPPLADWFNDIADAMDNAAHAKMPKLNASVGVTHTVASSPMAGGAAVGGGLVINILGPVTVRDDRDIDMIADRIAKRMKLKGHTGYRLGTV